MLTHVEGECGQWGEEGEMWHNRGAKNLAKCRGTIRKPRLTHASM